MSFLVLIIFGAALLALIAVLYYLARRKPRLRVVALILLGCVVTVMIFPRKPFFETQLSRFAGAVKQVMDADTLQTWAEGKLKAASQDSTELPVKEVPEALRKLASGGFPMEMALYEKTASPKDSCIVLMWGGGFGHWGIEVGAPSFEHPDDDNVYMTWAPGVYFWVQTK